MNDLMEGSEESIEDSGGALEQPESHPKKKPKKALSDSLQASLDALPDHPCKILRPELFEQANTELNRFLDNRKANDKSGMIMATIDGRYKFLYRDEKSRALHLFRDINGLCFPRTKSDQEKLRLEQGFEKGWADGSLSFLSGLTSGELDFYRGQIDSPLHVRVD